MGMIVLGVDDAIGSRILSCWYWTGLWFENKNEAAD